MKAQYVITAVLKNEICEFYKIILDVEEARYILLTRINTNDIICSECNFRYKEILKSLDFTQYKENLIDEFIILTNNILENK